MKKIVSMILILVCLGFLSACEKKTAIVFEETVDNENTVYRRVLDCMVKKPAF